MERLVDNEVKDCSSCQATVYQNNLEPLKMSHLPNGPWESVKVDFYGPLPSGLYLLTIADEYSRWVEVEYVTSTSAKCTIPKLDKVFTTYGIPFNIKPDNGPSFRGVEMKQFAEYLALTHRRITPLWPKANSSAEGFNRYLRKVVQSAKLEKKSW